MSHRHDRLALLPEQVTLPPGHPWRRLGPIGAAVGAVGIVASAALGTSDPERFFFSWLVSFLFFWSLALGAFYFVLIHWAMQGGWGVVVRRIAEHVMATIPVLALLFVPVLFGMERLYPWAVPGAAAKDHLLHWKEPFLNVPFFVGRAAIYFACWSVLAWVWTRGSLSLDATGSRATAARLKRFSGPGVIVLALTQTFAAFDWIMSLEPHWYSTIFGVYVFAGSLVSGVALIALLAVLLERAGPLSDVFGAEHRHDLGKLLFAFTVFWAYIAFCQFFLIWYANIPEETVWYKVRLEGSWKAVSVLLVLGHFVVPFFYFMGRTVKRKATALAAGAVWMLLMHFLDIRWLVLPALHGAGAGFSVLDATTFLAIGGCFAGVVGWRMRRCALVPLRDPRLPESLSYESA